jgi:hypothetical protein
MTFLVLIRRSFQIDEELLRQQQEAYKVEGVDETEAAHPRDRKRKKNHDAVRVADFAFLGLTLTKELSPFPG